MRRPIDVLMWILVAGGVGWLPACKPQADGEAQATGSPPRTRFDEGVDVAFEHDPDKRPLVLSDPAPTRREWVLQTLKTGYAKTGATNAAWDELVHSAFGAFADYTRGSPTNWPALERALSAVAATPCKDPMMQYLAVRYGNAEQTEEETALQFAQAHDAMLGSRHHPLFKFMAGFRAVQAARAADKTAERSRRIQRTTADLEDLARDRNAPVDEVFDASFLWLEHAHTKNWVQYVLGDLERLLEQNWGKTEQWHRFAGHMEVTRAWGERGGGWANTVTKEGWEGFEEHLGKAEQHLAKAWHMNSNHAGTAYLMMRVELGQGKGRTRMESWFNRAMTLAPKYYDAARLMSFYLEPRWYGSEKEALEFARSCVTSQEWGGQVPLVLAHLHHGLAEYRKMSNSPAYWHQPQVWQDVKSSYERFFTLNPEASGWRHDYAKDAYACGQYSVFLDQTRLFGSWTNLAFFGGREQFERMLETARAAVASSGK